MIVVRLAVVDARLVQAIDSGESTPMTAKDWKRIRTEGLKRVQSTRKSQSTSTSQSRGKK